MSNVDAKASRAWVFWLALALSGALAVLKLIGLGISWQVVLIPLGIWAAILLGIVGLFAALLVFGIVGTVISTLVGWIIDKIVNFKNRNKA